MRFGQILLLELYRHLSERRGRRSLQFILHVNDEFRFFANYNSSIRFYD